MNYKLALSALLASSGTGIFASAQQCPPKPTPIRDIRFHDIEGDGLHGYELFGNARIVEPAPDGIPRALRIDQVYSYALLKGVDISPEKMPEVTLSISAYIESIRPCPGCNEPDQKDSYGWVISHDNGGWDRAIFLHDERFNGMGMTSGTKPNSKYALTPTLKKWIHIIGVWRQGGECALYIEKQRVPFTQTLIGSNNAGRPDVAIGAPQQSSYGKGNDNDFWVKEVKIFDYALSDEEVKSLDCHFEETLEPTLDCGQGGDLVFSCTECVSGDGSASGCAGDCVWRPKVPNCVEKDDTVDNMGGPGVDCGDHNAADCSQCDVSADGSSGCAGECKFADGECRPFDWEPPAPTCPADGGCGKEIWVENFGHTAGGWRVEKHERILADVNGDGKDDVVGFGGDGVWVSLANCNGFDQPKFWHNNMSYNSGGWRVEKHPRFVADVNGDGKADIVGFGGAGVYVALSTGSSFVPKGIWVQNFSYNAGNWRVDMHPRHVVDVNGDGKADIVGFGYAGVYVSLSTGSGFSEPKLVVKDLGYTAGNWRVEKHPRLIDDVNGDGLPDIVGFGYAGALVSINTGNGSFAHPTLWHNNMGYTAGGWRVEKHPRMLADVNGDGKADLVGFGDAGVYVALSTGSSFVAKGIWVNNYSYNAGDWRVEKHPRFVADVNGDGKADIVGFGGDGVWVSLSTGSSFGQPQLLIKDMGYIAGNWRVDMHPRTVADVTGDGKADIVGFGYAGVHVGNLCL